MMTHKFKQYVARLTVMMGLVALIGCGQETSETEQTEAAAPPEAVEATQTAETASDGASSVADETASETAAPDAAADATKADSPAAMGVYGDVVLGSADAPVTIIEYASMTCPFCARFHDETLSKLKDTYIAQGQVKYIFRHYVMNQPDLAASTVARCGTEDQFFAMLDLLFARQRDWARQEFKDELAKLSRRAGLSRARFDQCLADRELQKSIIQQGADGNEEYAITATPTIIVNGQKQGNEALNYEALVALIEDEL